MKKFRDWRMMPKFMTISLLGMSVIAGVVFFYLLPLVQEKMMEGKRGMTKSVVEVAWQVFADHDEEVRRGTMSLEEAKRQAMEELRRMRYSGKEYLWINDTTPRMVMHPVKPELEGKEVGDQKDPSGKYLFREFISTCSAKGEGFVEYMWPKPGETDPQPKISYVKEYKPWGWIVGSGIYVDDVQKDVRKMAVSIVAAMMAAILATLGLIFTVTRYISRATDRLVESSSRLATGDLTVQVEVNSDDEVGKLASAFNQMGTHMKAVIGEVKVGAEGVAVTALQVNGDAESVATGMEQVAAQVSTVAVASEEMAATSQEISRSCADAATETRVARESVDAGTAVVCGTVSLMNDIAEQVRSSAALVEGLGERSVQIGEIVNTIDDIADQTNLLALNAAIEAARAGEQGRGFAVVADEVRALAERTSTSTKKIGEMIRSIQQEIGSAVHLMEQGVKKVESGTGEAARSGEALREINSRIAAVSEQIEHIATASEQQTATVLEVSNNIHEITQVVRQAADGANDSAGAAANQSRLAEDLQRLVGKFRVAA